MANDPIVIVSAVRTPIANFQGNFKNISAPLLGAAVIKAAFTSLDLSPSEVDEVLMGCVLPAGTGQAPARQAALEAGLLVNVGCTTLNKVCGSGMKAVMLAHDILVAGSQQIVVAGGMESMSNAPYLLPKARSGYRLGHQVALDHLFYDGLEDAYQKGCLMGQFAEDCASTFSLTREVQDKFALTSLNRAQKAMKEGKFHAEITPILVDFQKEGNRTVNDDEGPLTARPEKIPQLKPAFKETGTVTAANSSSISDGAAALVLMRHSEAVKRKLVPLATIVDAVTHSQAPECFATAPVFSIEKLLKRVGWKTQDVDLYEINEAFAVVTLIAMQELGLPHDKVNIHGGACALGHPIGASGARILVTLIHALRCYGLKRGVASLCIGGGEATAMAIEV